jgi:hypothetical protein
MDYQFVMSASELGLGCLNLPATDGRDELDPYASTAGTGPWPTRSNMERS